MNQRILELAKEHFCRVEFDNGSAHECYEFSPSDLEKFAELIVRECARLAIEKQTENDVSGIVSKNPAKDFAYALVEHFGVE